MTREDWRWLVIAIALPAIACAWRLNLPLWADEVYTLKHFASQPVAGIMTDYSAPNNHILYTLLIRPVFLLSSSELVLRLPSLAISLATLALVYRLACLWLGRAAAVWTTLLLGLNVMFLVHTMQLRGYGLSMLLVVALASLGASSALGRFDWLRAAAIALLGAGLLYTIPTNVLFLAPLTIWAAIVSWGASRSTRQALRALLPWLASWVLGCLCYLPVLSQLVAEASGASAGNFIALLREVWRAIGHDIWPLWLIVPAGIYCWWRRTRAEPRLQRLEFPLLVGLMLSLPFVLCLVLRLSPFVRNFCPLLPFVALGTAWMMHEVALALQQQMFAKKRSPRSQRKAAEGKPAEANALIFGGVLVTIALLLPANLLYPARLDRIRRQRVAHDGYYNYYAARFDPLCVAFTLRERVDPNETYLICYADSDHYDLIYQLSRVGFPIPPIHVAESRPHGPLFVIVPPLPDYDDLARLCNVTRAELESFTQLADCGYFRILQAPTSRTIVTGETP